MIDVDNEVFSIVSSKVRDAYPDIYMSGEYAKSTPSFQCDSLVEFDNTGYTSTLTSSVLENHVSVQYEEES